MSDGYWPELSREEYRALRGPINPDTLRVFDWGGDERLVPLPQGLLRDRLVEEHLKDAGVPSGEYDFSARSRAANAGVPWEGVVVYGLRPRARTADVPQPSTLGGIVSTEEEFGNGLAGWDPDKPLVIRLDDGAKALVLRGRRRWELDVAGSLAEALDRWIEEPGPGLEIGGGGPA